MLILIIQRRTQMKLTMKMYLIKVTIMKRKRMMKKVHYRIIENWKMDENHQTRMK